MEIDPPPEDSPSDKMFPHQSAEERPGSKASFPPPPEVAKEQHRIKTKNQPVCRPFSTGRCNYGYSRNFRNPQPVAPSRQDASLNGDVHGISTQGRDMCHYYRDGRCKYGVSCKYAHYAPACDPNAPLVLNPEVRRQTASASQSSFRLRR